MQTITYIVQPRRSSKINPDVSAIAALTSASRCALVLADLAQLLRASASECQARLELQVGVRAPAFRSELPEWSGAG
jgi:hypothetical protein